MNQAHLRALLTPARRRVVAAFDAEFDTAGDLRTQCVAVSLYLRDVLRAAGVADAGAVAGYFEIEDPDPETCACGSYRGDHDEACHYEPHAWVEAGGYLIDATASQFNHSNEQQLADLEVVPLAEALGGPWRRNLTWADDSWPTGPIKRLMGDWPKSLGPAPAA